MQKKVYLIDLSLDEVLERFEKGQKAYFETNDNYIEMIKNIFIEKNKSNKVLTLNAFICLHDCTAHFLDEVEEPEADESCIGKLCKFWDEYDSKIVYNILDEIRDKNEHVYIYVTTEKTVYEHCRPLTKEEALAFVKE